jgi:hypothetical protein
LGDDKFLKAIGESEVFLRIFGGLDHCGLLVEVRERAHVGWNRGRRKPKPVRYENMWQSHGEYMEFVNRTWDPGVGLFDLSIAANAHNRQCPIGSTKLSENMG